MSQITQKNTPKQIKIRERAAKLNPVENYIISIDNFEKRTNAGHIFVVTAETAADCEYEMTHRLCTAEEIEAYKVDEAKKRADYERREVERKQQLNINVTVPAQQPAQEPVSKKGK